MNNRIKMSQKELSKIPILQDVKDKKILSIEASKLLWISERQFRRIKKRYEIYGEIWLQHRWVWRISNNRISPDIIEKVKGIMLDDSYKDFGPTFMSEKLLEYHKIKISNEKIRQIMIEIGLWTVKTRGSPRQFKKRKRKDNYGEMQQFDGSYHLWFEYRNGWETVCLLLAIDDATWRITHAKFTLNEWKEAVFGFWKEYILLNKKPYSVYLDKFATYKNNYYANATYELEIITEFGRVCQTLWINMITAHSPQAKWRVERWNKTLQDRLVKELRLRGIDNIEDGNKYLQEEFIPEFNKRFPIEAANDIDLHKELTEEETKEFDWIFSKHKTRVINNDYTIIYKNRYYQLYQWIPRIYPKLKVNIEEQYSGKKRITYRGKEIEFKQIEERPPKYTREELEKKKVEKDRNQKELEKQRFKISKKRQIKYKVEKLILKRKSLQWKKEKS